MSNILLRDLAEEEKEKLTKLAKKNKRSVNSEILIAIEEYLKDKEV